MQIPMKTLIVFCAAAAMCILFFAQGYLFIRQVGVQEDEVLFLSAILNPVEATGWFGKLPIMILNYAGTFKALVYREIFRIVPPDARSIRMPVLLLGTATVFLFFLFFRMTLGNAAALIATALLAADPIFVITTVLDWGIDAVQHFLAAAALPLFVLFHRSRDTRYLKAACFLCGLALWDKVTFVWLLAGLAAGTWLVFGGEIRHHLKWRNFKLALVWMALGAAPLIYFNVIESAATIRESGGVRPPGSERIGIMTKSLDGSVLFGWLTRQDDGTPRREPQTALERAGVALSNATGNPESHGLLWACIGSLLLWRNRTVRFCAIAFAVGWLAMLPFAMGAAGTHHIVLLWPLPQMMVAAALCAIPRLKPALAMAAAAPLVIWCALVTNEYYAQIVTRGNVPNWSDAIEPLRQKLSGTPAGGILALDWGIMGPLRALGRGDLPLKYWKAEQAHMLAENPSFVFVRYVDRQGRDDEKFAALRNTGLSEELVAEIADRNGRPVYRVVRFREP
jgi:hypothetical protein